MLKVIQDHPHWYAKGLNFECTGCGQCCTGSPGYVWVDEQEILKIAEFLQLTVEEFSRCYLRRVQGGVSLIELPKTYDCIFLKDKKCQIYQVRPTQCRTFPWWPHHLKSENDWQEAARHCEGIHPEAPLVPIETIEQQREIQAKISYYEP
jgi:Fe-S-cluster containining protein